MGDSVSGNGGDRAFITPQPGYAPLVLWFIIALKIIFLFIIALNSRFVMDEFVQFGWAKYLGHGLFDTIWGGKAVGYAVFFKAAHLIGWNARSMLLIGRAQTALLGCGTLAIVYVTARTIGESRLRASGILLVLLSFSNFMERIFRTIAEPPALFFAAASLLIVLRGGPDNRKVVVLAGVLCGLAFLTTQKSLYFDVALGLGLVVDAAIQRRWLDGLERGSLLVLGWALSIAAYCLVFKPADPSAVARSVFFGPAAVMSPNIAAAYGGLRQYVIQTLERNLLLYLFCFGGMILATSRIARLEARTRIALIFTWVITILVFTHDQPWPYVFIMALPFMALWSMRIFDVLSGNKRFLWTALSVLAVGVGTSFVQNIRYLRIDNGVQLQLVDRAEALLRPQQTYFDGVGMLPNRFEPSTLWLDRRGILETLAEGQSSEAYRVFAHTPPTLVLWSYRMDGIAPIVGPFIRTTYVKICPNLFIVGRRLKTDEELEFDVPATQSYALYGPDGAQLASTLLVDGRMVSFPLKMIRGRVSLRYDGPLAVAYLLPQSNYRGKICPQSNEQNLFGDVYN